jgi:hypothetical protein
MFMTTLLSAPAACQYTATGAHHCLASQQRLEGFYDARSGSAAGGSAQPPAPDMRPATKAALTLSRQGQAIKTERVDLPFRAAKSRTVCAAKNWGSLGIEAWCPKCPDASGGAQQQSCPSPDCPDCSACSVFASGTTRVRIDWARAPRDTDFKYFAPTMTSNSDPVIPGKFLMPCRAKIPGSGDAMHIGETWFDSNKCRIAGATGVHEVSNFEYLILTQQASQAPSWVPRNKAD